MDSRKEIIEQGLLQGLTTKDIGRKIGGVSRQRVYQLMDKYGIKTPERHRKGYWKQQDDKIKWLSRTLNSKSIGRVKKNELVDYLADKLPEVCPILGIPLVYGAEGTRTDNSASIDRLDSAKGYEPGNVSIISWRANRIKNDSTPEELQKLLDWHNSKKM